MTILSTITIQAIYICRNAQHWRQATNSVMIWYPWNCKHSKYQQPSYEMKPNNSAFNFPAFFTMWMRRLTLQNHQIVPIDMLQESLDPYNRSGGMIGVTRKRSMSMSNQLYWIVTLNGYCHFVWKMGTFSLTQSGPFQPLEPGSLYTLITSVHWLTWWPPHVPQFTMPGTGQHDPCDKRNHGPPVAESPIIELSLMLTEEWLSYDCIGQGCCIYFIKSHSQRLSRGSGST